ncbi:MAG: tetratricopeptide repeat protein [Gemmatimonadales bacterium]|jgi:tetratricopeptide (TPR) repeat protein
MRRRYRVLVILLLAMSSLAEARPQERFFEDGNRLYQQGDYQAALDNYQRIIDSGLESAALHYNIGNAYFKLGQLGEAILHYERARRLAPGDADVRANLELARSLTVDEVTPLPRFWLVRAVEWWVGLLPRGWLVLAVGAGYGAAVAGLVVMILRRGTVVARWARWLAIGAATVTLILGINLAVRELEIGEPEEAIIMAEETPVQSAPSDDRALQVFTIHEGTKVRIDQRSEDWVEIVLEDGKVGWVKTEALEVI